MGESVLKDGLGTGNRAGVTSNGKLLVRASVQPIIASIAAETGLTIAFGSGVHACGTPAQEYPLIWIKNNEASLNYHLNFFWLGWNGGDTSFSKPAHVRFYNATAMPTANHVEIPVGSLNLGRSVNANLEAYAWDGVGNGLTVSDNGAPAGDILISQGTQVIDAAGMMIIAPGAVLMLSMEPYSEGGDGNIIMAGYLD